MSTHAPSGNGSEQGAIPRKYGDADISALIKDQEYAAKEFAAFRIEQRAWNAKADQQLDKVLETVNKAKGAESLRRHPLVVGALLAALGGVAAFSAKPSAEATAAIARQAATATAAEVVKQMKGQTP